MATLRRFLPTLLLALTLAAGALAAFFGYESIGIALHYTAPEVILHPAGSDGDVRSRVYGANLTSYTATVKASTAVDTICNPWFSGDLLLYSPRLDANLLLCWMRAANGSRGYTALVYYDPTVSFDDGTGSVAVYANVSSEGVDYNYVYGLVFQPFIYFGGGYGVDDYGTANITFSFNGAVDSVGGYVEAYLIAIITDSNFNLLGYSLTLVYWASYGITLYSLLDGNWHNVTFSYTPSDLNMTGGREYYVFIGFLVNVSTQTLFWLTFDGLFQGTVHIDLVHHQLPMVSGAIGFYLTEPVFRVEYNSTVYSRFNITLRGRGASGLYTAYGWFMNATGQAVGANVSIDGAGLDIGIVGVYAVAPAGASGWLNVSLAYYTSGVRVEYPLDIEFVDPEPLKSAGLAASLTPVSANASIEYPAPPLHGVEAPRLHPPGPKVVETILASLRVGSSFSLFGFKAGSGLEDAPGLGLGRVAGLPRGGGVRAGGSPALVRLYPSSPSSGG